MGGWEECLPRLSMANAGDGVKLLYIVFHVFVGGLFNLHIFTSLPFCLGFALSCKLAKTKGK